MLVLTRPGDKERIERLAFSPDGEQIAGGTNNGHVHLWMTALGTSSEVATGMIDGTSLISGVTDLGFSPDGRYLLVGLGTPPGLLIRDLKQGSDLTDTGLYRTTGLAVAPVGNGCVYFGSPEVAIG